MKTFQRVFPVVEILESRIAPAVHTWTGTGADNLWSNASNWAGGSPATDVSGDIDLFFPTNAAQLVVQNDIGNLVVDSITFSVGGGTSANGYTINGNTIIISTGAAGQDPFGIDVAAGVADPNAGITQTFNTNISLSVLADATFRTQQSNSRLIFNGDINLGTRTLTIDAAGINNAAVDSFVITGDISFGSLVKNSGGTLRLSGDNSYANTIINNGNVLAESDTALGATTGTITINDPAHLDLRNGVTVVKTTLNLNSNQLGGGLGANGNTENTFRGSVVLMAGAGGVALGAGVGVANAGTRLIIDGPISGATSTLSLNGAGVIEFTQNNSYTGRTNHNGNNGFGALQIDTPGGLGASGVGNETQLNRNGAGPTGSALWLNFSGTTNESIDFAGSGVEGLGAIRVLGHNDARVTGAITFIAGAPWFIGVDSKDGSLTTTGVISSEGVARALTKVGAGELVIAGSGSNTYSGGTIVQAGVLHVENTSGSPLGAAPTTVKINTGATLRMEANATLPNDVLLFPGATLAGSGRITGAVSSAGGIVSPGASPGGLHTDSIAFDSKSVFRVEVNGTTPGSTFDQLDVNGSVVLKGTKLKLTAAAEVPVGAQLTIIDNAGADPVTGTFAGLPEGKRIVKGPAAFKISYTGGDGNDVVLTSVPLVNSFQILAGGKQATFIDSDGDFVTMTTSAGKFLPANFDFRFNGDRRQQIETLTLGATFAGANIQIDVAQQGAGNGFTSIGLVNATGVDLGVVTIDGAVGRIVAGNAGAPTPAIKALTVRALTGPGTSLLTGKLGALTMETNLTAGLDATESIGAVTIGGSIVGGSLRTSTSLGAVLVGGNIIGTPFAPVVISAFGKATAPTSGIDLAIKSLNVGGKVEYLNLLAGYAISGARNADASIGAVTIGKTLRSSNLVAGVDDGADNLFGTLDDVKIPGATRDNASIQSQIASVIVNGQVGGTSLPGDNFGIVAEKILKLSVAGARIPLTAGVDVLTLGTQNDYFAREDV